MKKTLPEEIRDCLLSMQDEKYRDFHSALMPTVDKDLIIGVRMPLLRTFGKELYKTGNYEEFLGTLPHFYYEENNLHGILIEKEKDFEKCISRLDAFLPYVDNWATCDQLSPKVFAKKKGGRLVYGAELLRHIDRWLCSCETYTVRFGIGMLLAHYLDGDFDPAWMDRVAEIRSGEYYINMMIAWYFATALAKQWDAAHDVLIHNRLDVWTHNKAIQKAVESRRITDEQKAYLRTLKRK